uniref:Ribose-phosphate pyrophosphokinase N-terminal domain-containing protein n=1 Tax=Chromera velia CCMP2878 TaxID=1169474 RepID=A0A0G4HPE7_9ALVE|eukprot:Cvel_7738.t1-p1 / transcript=Cvel_7738.t1 / gene=Cvel_7738 / organism=Chromera_velia_CCMP2878 / gene_product=Ribose-phosphate pyrophosphokinase 4, putative / transcript_product=Ribose-phosphate pyrophosphokinase 4, putative / location=Cvel_scaffold411:81823-86684(-) / protein_length=363 / sequence_SO=supercontig / SO=protein_coding / is_pseudo=false
MTLNPAQGLTSPQMSSDSLMRISKTKPMVLFHCPEFSDLAAEIVKRDPETFLLGKITWDKFEDGFPNFTIHRWSTDLRNRHVVFLASFLLEKAATSIFDQISVIWSFPRSSAKSLTVILPYFPTGTMERVESEGQIATAKTMARLLSTTPFCRGSGPAQVAIMDIHALQERFYFADTVLPIFLTAIPMFIEAIQDIDLEGPVAIAFPDDGARKRFGKQFKELASSKKNVMPGDEPCEIIVCTKVREGNKRVVKIHEGDAQGKHVFIVDDLIKTGGTILQCKKVLEEAGAAAVGAFATHGVFPEESWRKFQNAGFSHVFLTNSCPQIAKEVEGKEPFKVLSIADALLDFLKNESSTKFFCTERK